VALTAYAYAAQEYADSYYLPHFSEAASEAQVALSQCRWHELLNELE
jgi:hypothetical protein